MPHAEYAEDQLHQAGILTAHVAYRGLQSGAIVGAATGAVRAMLLGRKAVPSPLLRTVFLNSTGIGGVIGLGIATLIVPLRMMGREKIEWQDRSWRLLANKHQEEVDDWTFPGTILGAAAVVFRGARPLSWKSVVGGAAVGNLTALGALMVWRLTVREEPQENVTPSGPISPPSLKL